MIKLMMEFDDDNAMASVAGDWAEAGTILAGWLADELAPLPPGFANPHSITEITMKSVGKD